MKIIITGALGHIGSSLIRYLSKVEEIERIYLIDNFSAQRYCSLFNLPREARYSFFDLDLAKCKETEIPQADLIIHLAAKTDAAQSPKYEKVFYKNNFAATKNVIKYTKKTKSKLIFASSTSVYGPQSNLVDENCNEKELKPQTPHTNSSIITCTMLSCSE